MHYDTHQGEDVAEMLQMVLDTKTYDLIIIGASHEWRIRNFLFGSIPDIVADHAQCSVLMVRRYLLER
jgi:nucleotide-binding universal stress UspA family protein